MHFLLRGGWDWVVSHQGAVVGGVSAAFGLFFEGAKDKRWRWLAVVGILAGVSLALSKDKQDESDRLQDIQTVVARVDANVQTRLQPVEQILQRIEDQGVTTAAAQGVTVKQAAQILASGEQADAMTAEVSPQRRQELKICYFDHFLRDVNFEVVKPRLQKLAANVVPCKARLPEDFPSNSVWWGPGANLGEAKVAALLAMSAGVAISQICPATTVRTTNLIQIGGSVQAKNLKPLTVAEVQGISEPICVPARDH